MSLTEKQKLRLEVMNILITDEVEYCLSLAYNNDEKWELEDRVADLIKTIQSRAKEPILSILGEYDADFFPSHVQAKVKELYGIQVGDKLTLKDHKVGTVVKIEGMERYGLLVFNGAGYNVEYLSDTPQQLRIKLNIKQLLVEDE